MTAINLKNSARSLAPLTTAHSWRVLNLASLPADQRVAVGGQSVKPFFHNRILDRAIFIKHNLRHRDHHLFDAPPDLSTKIIVPFNCDDLSLGGYSVFHGESRFSEKLCEVAGIDPRAHKEDAHHDFEVLDCIARCPTLDPFVLRHMLLDAGFTIDERYFRINAERTLKLNTKLISDIKPLIAMAINKEPSEGEVRVFLDSVFRQKPTQLGLSFLNAIAVSTDDWPEMLFSWKAAIVAEDATERLAQSVKEFTSILKEIRVAPTQSNDILAEIARRKKVLYETVLTLYKSCNVKAEKFGAPARDEIIRTGKIANMKGYLTSLKDGVREYTLAYSQIDQIVSLVRFYFAKRGWSQPAVTAAEDFIDVTNPVMEICLAPR